MKTAMTSDPVFQRLRDIAWRRRLTDAEQAEVEAWLIRHPDARPEWEAETGLTASLSGLADATVPSNFTSRVLQAVKGNSTAESRPTGLTPWWQVLGWKWRGASGATFAALVLFTGLLVWHHQLRAGRKEELARSVALVAGGAAMPSPEVLANFDAIRALGPGPQPDEQLLTLLQ